MSAAHVGAGEGRVQAQAAVGCQRGKEEEERGSTLSTGSCSPAQAQGRGC